MVSYTAMLRYSGRKQMVRWSAKTQAYSRARGLQKQKGIIGGKSLFATLQHTEQLLTLSQEFALQS